MTGLEEHVIETREQLATAVINAFVDGTPEERQAIVDDLTARSAQRQKPDGEPSPQIIPGPAAAGEPNALRTGARN